LLIDAGRRVWLLGAGLAWCGVGTAGMARSAGTTTADRIVLPPDLRSFSSPSGQYVLELSSADHWRTRLARARLLARNSGSLEPAWTQTLPHERGPRHVLVTDTGAVVLIDEWINVPSRHALMLLSPGGERLAHYSIDALVQMLGVPRRTVAEHGKLGIWLSAAPSLAPDGSAVVLPSAGRRLLLRLADGSLSAAD
jgi:hypothetical protein